MEKIKTASGKIFDSDYLTTIPAPKQAYLRILGESLSNVAKVFGDPKETKQLWYGDQYLSGYTSLVAIIPEMNAVKVVLAKG